MKKAFKIVKCHLKIRPQLLFEKISHVYLLFDLYIRTQDSEKYADTTSFAETAVTTKLVVTVISLIVTTKLAVMLQPS